LATSAQQIRAWRGSAIFRYGFRPFFLGAAAFAAGAMVIWIWSLAAGWVIPSAYSPVDWHAHEFLWGYLYAVAAGFLLTAIPNWTGRLPVVGLPLAVLWILWLCGRLAMFFSSYMPPLSAAIDLLFPAPLLLWSPAKSLPGKTGAISRFGCFLAAHKPEMSFSIFRQS
jgi:uncharacterized protein involved in response to NO